MLSFDSAAPAGAGAFSTRAFYHKAFGTYKTALKKTAKKLKKGLDRYIEA